MTDLGTFSYDLSVPPPAYRCADCGVFGPKLWRESYSSHVVLRCVLCAAAHVGRVPDLNDSDQIGSYVPAVPNEDGTATALEAAIDAYGQAAYERGYDGRPLLSGRSETSTLAQFAAEDALFALSDGIRRGTGRIP